MPTYVNVNEAGEIVTQVSDRESLPESWIYPDGSGVSGFNKLDDEDLVAAGWLPVETEDRPQIDDTTQRLINERIEIRNGIAVRTWDAEDIPPPEPQPEPTPSLEDRIAVLEAEIAALKSTP